jgi:hypothetical protein
VFDTLAGKSPNLQEESLMRIMVKFSFPTETGNDALQDGTVAKVFEGIMKDLKPEAAYFYTVDGERGGHFVVNMTEGADIIAAAERLFLGLDAAVEMVPVMSAEDMQKGMSTIAEIAEAYT